MPIYDIDKIEDYFRRNKYFCENANCKDWKAILSFLISKKCLNQNIQTVSVPYPKCEKTAILIEKIKKKFIDPIEKSCPNNFICNREYKKQCIMTYEQFFKKILKKLEHSECRKKCSIGMDSIETKNLNCEVCIRKIAIFDSRKKYPIDWTFNCCDQKICKRLSAIDDSIEWDREHIVLCLKRGIQKTLKLNKSQHLFKAIKFFYPDCNPYCYYIWQSLTNCEEWEWEFDMFSENYHGEVFLHPTRANRHVEKCMFCRHQLVKLNVFISPLDKKTSDEMSEISQYF